MISKRLNITDMINGLSKELPGELFFFVADGPLKNKLIETYLEEDAHADILEFDLDASVRIKRGDDSKVPVFECHLEVDDFQYQTTFSVEDFTAEEIAELMEHLNTQTQSPHQQDVRPDKNILRKKTGSGLLNIAAAATALGLSHQSLKTLIPCSEIRIAEKDGNKTIEEYYWGKDLIDRFKTLSGGKQTRGRLSHEDVTFIAERCCDGDRQWARDCIAGVLKQSHSAED